MRCYLQELGKENTSAIKKQRKKYEGQWTDSAGYDLIVVPQVGYFLPRECRSSSNAMSYTPILSHSHSYLSSVFLHNVCPDEDTHYK